MGDGVRGQKHLRIVDARNRKHALHCAQGNEDAVRLHFPYHVRGGLGVQKHLYLTLRDLGFVPGQQALYFFFVLFSDNDLQHTAQFCALFN